MPGNILNADISFPQFTGEETNAEKIEKISSYLFMLLEQLRYTLGNIDKNNFNENGLEEIANIITEPLYIQISDDKENILALQVTAESLQSRVGNAEGDISQLVQTSEALSSQITSAEGEISRLDQTASSLSSRITGAEGQVSTLSQTVNGLTLQVSNGSSSSTIRLLANGVQLASQSISFSGVVEFTDLSTAGRCVINGGNIDADTITAAKLKGRDISILGSNNATYGNIYAGTNSAGTTALELEGANGLRLISPENVFLQSAGSGGAFITLLADDAIQINASDILLGTTNARFSNNAIVPRVVTASADITGDWSNISFKGKNTSGSDVTVTVGSSAKVFAYPQYNSSDYSNNYTIKVRYNGGWQWCVAGTGNVTAVAMAII